MKKSILVISLSLLVFAVSAEAKIQKKTFESNTTLTAGQLFLSQVDTISLYLTTQNVVYVPRLTKENQLQVDLVFLQRSLAEKEGLQQFSVRHIQTFQKALKDRLELYTPELAKEFDVNQDIQFTIKVGRSGQSVALWRDGNWYWIKGEAMANPPVPQGEPVSQVIQEQEIGCKARCPALISKKEKKIKKKEQEVPQVSSESEKKEEKVEKPEEVETETETSGETPPAAASPSAGIGANTQIDAL